MSDFKKNIDHIAELSRLKLSREEKNLASKNLEKVLDYVELLQEVDTEKVKPLFNPVTEYSHATLLREDVIDDSRGAKETLSNAPEQKNQQFLVHAVIEES